LQKPPLLTMRSKKCTIRTTWSCARRKILRFAPTQRAGDPTRAPPPLPEIREGFCQSFFRAAGIRLSRRSLPLLTRPSKRCGFPARSSPGKPLFGQRRWCPPFFFSFFFFSFLARLFANEGGRGPRAPTFSHAPGNTVPNLDGALCPQNHGGDFTARSIRRMPPGALSAQVDRWSE